MVATLLCAAAAKTIGELRINLDGDAVTASFEPADVDASPEDNFAVFGWTVAHMAARLDTSEGFKGFGGDLERTITRSVAHRAARRAIRKN